MKSATFRLDRHVYELLKDEKCQQFTIRSLRERYASLAGRSDDRSALWRYVYDQVRRLQRVGWVSQDRLRRKRDQLFHVMDMPDALVLVLVDPRVEITNAKQSPDRLLSADTTPQSHTNPASRLESLAKEVRLDMLTAIGEAERYKQLLTEMPALKSQIEDDYLDARDRSSRLLGHLRAIENTIKLLVIQ